MGGRVSETETTRLTVRGSMYWPSRLSPLGPKGRLTVPTASGSVGSRVMDSSVCLSSWRSPSAGCQSVASLPAEPLGGYRFQTVPVPGVQTLG